MQIREPAPENFLYTLWLNYEQLRGPFYTVDGRRVEIVYPGTRNCDSGPDFMNATILLDGIMNCGDIEVHPVAGDWYHHAHQHDPRYNNVILHVVTMDCCSQAITERADGVKIPILNLDSFLPKPSEQLAEESSQKTQENIALRDCPLHSLDVAQILHVVESAGINRLRDKARRLEEERLSDSWDQIIYRSLAEALGYSKNQIPFRKLATELPVVEIWDGIRGKNQTSAELSAQAYLFGAAGLIPTVSNAPEDTYDDETVEFLQKIKKAWENFSYRRKIDVMSPLEWLFFRLRPNNFPTRRIAGLAFLVVRFENEGFHSSIYKIFHRNRASSSLLLRELHKVFIVQASEYWISHFTFEKPLQKKLPRINPKLIGKDRAAEIIINVVFPFMFAFTTETGDSRGKNSILQLFSLCHSLPDNTITRTMKQQLFSDKGQNYIDTARKQQGIIQLYKTYCRMGECEACLNQLELNKP